MLWVQLLFWVALQPYPLVSCPAPFITWKKDLVKHVFKFGSMRQNLDVPNQIVSMFEKNTVVVT